MDENAIGVALEINPVVPSPVAVERSTIARDAAEFLALQRVEVARQEMKLRQKIELQILRQRGHFAGTDGVEYHLKHNAQ